MASVAVLAASTALPSVAEIQELEPMPGLAGKDYGKTRLRCDLLDSVERQPALQQRLTAE